MIAASVEATVSGASHASAVRRQCIAAGGDDRRGTFAATLFCTIDGPVTGSKMVTISNGSFNVLRAF
jgi:hypothetical protein